ncbi:hypothetical protein PHLCEN_2v930 [Hermanssonia centrifuga]|uniref:Uncharacterized protein n=1 Tax=Hermanssonia centrifuga TaxID=98765 RepID=A0A2R6S4P6_9APHY|nr:hypothetical protein PHLCEN_2v930 [Hermanssonia centrifuga]
MSTSALLPMPSGGDSGDPLDIEPNEIWKKIEYEFSSEVAKAIGDKEQRLANRALPESERQLIETNFQAMMESLARIANEQFNDELELERQRIIAMGIVQTRSGGSGGEVKNELQFIRQQQKILDAIRRTKGGSNRVVEEHVPSQNANDVATSSSIGDEGNVDVGLSQHPRSTQHRYSSSSNARGPSFLPINRAPEHTEVFFAEPEEDPSLNSQSSITRKLSSATSSARSRQESLRVGGLGRSAASVAFRTMNLAISPPVATSMGRDDSTGLAMGSGSGPRSNSVGSYRSGRSSRLQSSRPEMYNRNGVDDWEPAMSTYEEQSNVGSDQSDMENDWHSMFDLNTKREEDKHRADQWDEEASRREKELKQKEEAVKEKEEAVKQKEETLKRKEEEAMQRVEEVRRKEEDVSKMEEDARKMEEDARTKEEALKQKENALKQKENALKQKEETELSKRAAAADELRNERKRHAERLKIVERTRKIEEHVKKKEEDTRQTTEQQQIEEVRKMEALLRKEEELRREELRRREEELDCQEAETKRQGADRCTSECPADLAKQNNRCSEEVIVEQKRIVAELAERQEEHRRAEQLAEELRIEQQSADLLAEHEQTRREQQLLLEQEESRMQQKLAEQEEMYRAQLSTQEEEMKQAEDLRKAEDLARQLQRGEELGIAEQEQVRRAQLLAQEKERARFEAAVEARQRADAEAQQTRRKTAEEEKRKAEVEERHKREEFLKQQEEVRRRAEDRKHAWSNATSGTQTSGASRTATPARKTAKLAGGAWKTASANGHARPEPSSNRKPSQHELERSWHERQEELVRKQAEQLRQERFSRMAQKNQLKSMNKDDVIRVFMDHERQWSHLQTMKIADWNSFPWPTFDRPSNPEELTPETIRAYISSPHNSSDKPGKDRLKEQIRRWHPDHFEIKLLPKVRGDDREKVKEGAGRVARNLNDLLTLARAS